MKNVNTQLTLSQRTGSSRADETSEHEVDLEERWPKRRKIEQNQQKYNEKMVEQTHKNNNARKKKTNSNMRYIGDMI